MAIQFLRGTKSKVEASTKVLADGQPLYETDTNKLKVGDGSTQAKSLPYVKVDTDSELSLTSTNPVQNKVINTKFTSVQSDIDTKQTKITASGILKGNGAGGVSAAVKGTDYAAPSVGVSVTLTAAGWDANAKTQTVSVAGVTATANGSLRLGQSATDEQFTAWGSAQPRVTAQADGSITVKLAGTVPTIDIPVEVLIV